MKNPTAAGARLCPSDQPQRVRTPGMVPVTCHRLRARRARSNAAFTLVDGLITGALVLMLAAFLLPALAPAKCKCQKINCVNNLKQVGLGFRIWEGDNGDQFPMDVAVTNGGAREWMATGNVAACFQVMSNELATAKILVCPEDKQHACATNFTVGFTAANLSYFVALHATNDQPDTALSGDANLVQNHHPVPPGLLNLWTNTTTWTRLRHKGTGNVLYTDGSVFTVKQIGYPASADTFAATNRVVVP